MIKQWKQIYDFMQQELLEVKARALPMDQEIESCFEICNGYLTDINAMQHEEKDVIYFNKHVLPLFIAECEYCTLLSYSRLFRPNDNPGDQFFFWERESNRFAKFVEKHNRFLDYYLSGSTERDELYFSTPSNEYGSIISGYLSLKKYNSFVAEELAVLVEFPAKEPVHAHPLFGNKKFFNIAKSLLAMNFIK